MKKIATKGIKIDLHIHSEFSKGKDGQKVAENTLSNLPVLVKGYKTICHCMDISIQISNKKKNEVETCVDMMSDRLLK